VTGNSRGSKTFKMQLMKSEVEKDIINKLGVIEEGIPIEYSRNILDSVIQIVMNSSVFLIYTFILLALIWLDVQISIIVLSFILFGIVGGYNLIWYGYVYLPFTVNLLNNGILINKSEKTICLYKWENIKIIEFYTGDESIKKMNEVLMLIKLNDGEKVKMSIFRYRGSNPYYKYLDVIKKLKEFNINYKSEFEPDNLPPGL
jgi:hypothetical protein